MNKSSKKFFFFWFHLNFFLFIFILILYNYLSSVYLFLLFFFASVVFCLFCLTLDTYFEFIMRTHLQIFWYNTNVTNQSHIPVCVVVDIFYRVKCIGWFRRTFILCLYVLFFSMYFIHKNKQFLWFVYKFFVF